MSPHSRAWRPAVTSDSFSWRIPETFNIGTDCTASRPEDPAIIVDRESGEPFILSFGELRDRSLRLITLLRARGVRQSDRVSVMCAQSAETAIAHMAIYRMGAIAVPLSVKFGPEAALFRIRDAGVVAGVFDAACHARLADDLPGLSDLSTVLVTGSDVEATNRIQPFNVIDEYEPARDLPDTTPDDPALLIYTSGTTGQPKGTLHAHRVVLAHLPGVSRSQDQFPQDGDVFWTPADWAWAGGLLDVLLPSLYYGVPVIASTAKPVADTVERILREHRVTCAFLPPTILKQMRASGVDFSQTRLRAACAGGEALGESVAAWARESLGIKINEIYGQTEINLIIGTCHAAFSSPPGSMGTPTPGFDLVMLDPMGQEASPGEVGEVCIRLPSPGGFLGYWNQPAKTEEKMAGGVIHTGDLARRDADGFLWFEGRSDDVISSAGYRVGPGEIEEQIIRHPSVQLVAVIGVPDDLRGEAIVAYVVPADGVAGTDQLAREIQEFVKQRLAFYQYPRQVLFCDSLPTSTTGKIRRADLRSRHGKRGSR